MCDLLEVTPDQLIEISAANVEQRSRCPRCGVGRLLPELANGAPVCRDCAGIVRTFTCTRCSDERWLHRRQVCVRCRLDDLAPEPLADDTGTVPRELEALVRVLARCYKSSPVPYRPWPRS